MLALPSQPTLSADIAKRLTADFERFLDEPLPQPLEGFIGERYGIDLSTRYGGYKILNPFGKASGQLSMELHQVQTDADASLSFCVLKTVIAQDASGKKSMSAWAIPVTRMKVERIRGKDGTEGWTVSWKGRGWYGTFEEYLDFFDEALQVGKSADMLIIPSVKYHLPAPGESEWRIGEYEYTTRELLKVWQRHHPNQPMPLEKDFSPTLAGSDLAKQKATILKWLRKVPKLVKTAGNGRVAVGIKVFNAMFEDDFQLQMLRTLIDEAEDGVRADWLIYANRLFDPQREFDGHKGIAYGGPDLSARNFKVLTWLREAELRGDFRSPVMPISATGDIDCGTKAFRYLLLGCENCQLHTFWQLPLFAYPKRTGSRMERALHKLYFDPHDGLLAWLLWMKEQHGVTRLADVAHWYRHGIDPLTH